MSSPVDSTSLLIPTASGDLCGAILAIVQSISVLRADYDYRVDTTDGNMPGVDFSKDLARRIPALYGVATAIANDYSLVLPVPFASYAELTGRLVAAQIPSANTGAATLRIGKTIGTSTTYMEARSIKVDTTTEVPSSGLGTHKTALFLYDGTQFILLNKNTDSSEAGANGITFSLPTTPGGSYAAVSSLTDLPKKVYFKVRCTTDDHGYTAGEEIDASQIVSTNRNQSYPTFFYVASPTGIAVHQMARHADWDTDPLACSNIPNKSTGVRTEPFDPAKWSGVIYYSTSI